MERISDRATSLASWSVSNTSLLARSPRVCRSNQSHLWHISLRKIEARLLLF